MQEQRDLKDSEDILLWTILFNMIWAIGFLIGGIMCLVVLIVCFHNMIVAERGVLYVLMVGLSALGVAGISEEYDWLCRYSKIKEKNNKQG